MGTGAITQYIDVAQIVLYMFWIFFAGLIYYLIREGHREGYPMVSEGNGWIEGWPPAPSPKTYLLDNGQEIQIPRESEPEQTFSGQRAYKTASSPLEPVGDPLSAGIGPGAWSALRPDEADLDHHGEPKIVPLSMAPEFGVSARDTDPRGLVLLDAEGDAFADQLRPVENLLDFGRAHAIAGGLHHLVAPADEVEEALLVHAHRIARKHREFGNHQSGLAPRHMER